MAVSTVEVRAHGIRLTGQGQTSISPSRASDTGVSALRGYRQPKAEVSSYSLSGVMLTQGQQHATSVQIATQTLQSVGKTLTGIKRTLTPALQYGVNASSSASLKESLSAAKAQITQVLEQARFDGKRVVDNELRLKLDRADIRRFSVPGLNINRSTDKAEQIRLDFPQGGSVMIQFDGQSDGQKAVKMLDRSLLPMGMRASVSENGDIIFEAKESSYQQMQQKVMVSGQGYRFPAGQPNALTLKSEPDGIAELKFDLSSRDGIKKTISSVNQHLQQVQSSLQDARQFYTDLSAQMNSLRSETQTISGAETEQMLTSFSAASQRFTSVYQALNAQANVRRHTVVALLR
ncbi:hypothetical protein VA7868_01814 [Vibrio aerogenes CECT 7868]|uniref:Flagellin n=1 Tax=Vibrio aerogenes CECT 7868 TaxID=1216006 RepID=A0A1M5YKX6_9VIBR|nr:flagellin [Vibrio aerogenes]SHI12538.1 hypothetical protein VA7868_01814 [Vibrio aerogenes CECT 7868]